MSTQWDTKEFIKAQDFYENTLDLNFSDIQIFGASAQPFTNLADPGRYSVVGWRVPNLADAIEALEERGITMEIVPGIVRTEKGICLFPSGERIAFFNDPIGNLLRLQEDTAMNSQGDRNIPRMESRHAT